MKNFTLKDDLHSKFYSWPKTLLNYKFNDEMPKSTDVLMRNGKQIAYQAEKTKSGYSLKIISDLATDGKYDFVWKKGKNGYENIAKSDLRNEFFKVKNVKGGLIKVIHNNGAEFTYTLKTEKKIISEKVSIEGGAVEGILKKTVLLEDNCKYIFTAKVKRELDYVEIYEDMSGFKENQALLEITWKGFNPSRRYTLDREVEKIDAYLHADKSLPFMIDPFMARCSWWDQKYFNFIDVKKNFWSGLLLHDIANFDDGKYEIWGSGYTLAIKLYTDRWIAPLANGKRAFIQVLCNDKKPEEMGATYLKYYSHVSLDKVKDWVLSWEDDKSKYPKYFEVDDVTEIDYWRFKRVGKPDVSQMLDMLDATTGGKTPFHNLELVEPVGCRGLIYQWAAIFDMTASRMTDEEFARVRAAMALCCYVFSSENYYPVNTMLAGHPNFITDVVGVVGVFSALLGENHPMHQKWLEYFETVQARNLKYHTRPDVKAWDAKGGRWTENVGCYMFGMLHCSIYCCNIIYHTCGKLMPMLYPHFKNLVEFVVNMQMPEDKNGIRKYPPQGSHSCTGEFGGRFGHGFITEMIQLAEMCADYYPLLSEYIVHNFREHFDELINSKETYYNRSMQNLVVEQSYKKFAVNNGGTTPDLHSEKYTGHGFLMRYGANTKRESYVFLQQIDEGPNYRWGRPSDGGCGEIYYYAENRKLTDHSPEDVGDENRGDAQCATNFGVLIGHEFRSVGRNDLTEPLMDFDFVQYARVNAGEYSKPYYKYRSVMAVEDNYIAIYDAIADKRQYGKFTWAQNDKDEFPIIYNLRPGVNAIDLDSGFPVDNNNYYNRNYPQSREKVFEGWGDFLNIVSPSKKKVSNATLKDYGALVELKNRQDYLFMDDACSIVDENVKFIGKVGYATTEKDVVKMAIFDGSSIVVGKVKIEIPSDDIIRHGISFVCESGRYYGKAVFKAQGKVKITAKAIKGAKLYIDGLERKLNFNGKEYLFNMPKGAHRWCIANKPMIETPKIIETVVKKGGFTAVWNNTVGAEKYQVEISSNLEKTYKKCGEVSDNVITLKGLKDGKYHIRIRGLRDGEAGEYSHPYPIYVNGKKANTPAGLRVEKIGNKFKASWGEVLGVSEYRLYNGNKLVYKGKANECIVNSGEYSVSAVNGNGESERSSLRSTKSPLAVWDNHPEKGFVRDTRSHEHGFQGFDYLNNPYKRILKYPEDK